MIQIPSVSPIWTSLTCLVFGSGQFVNDIINKCSSLSIKFNYLGPSTSFVKIVETHGTSPSQGPILKNT